ncbi:MAG: putative quinol monooxygenase [Propionibacteriaceae bacterium]|nr:putative quinol monooxygenase [Propionibacteriaceae bacterium]
MSRGIAIPRRVGDMIFIVVKFPVKPDHVAEFQQAIEPFTRGSRQEPGNLWFEWSRGLEDPNEFVLVEAFKDDAAEAHVTSAHFSAALEAMRPHLVRTPQIISRVVAGNGWDEMGELQIE